jgi:hypothetical protein
MAAPISCDAAAIPLLSCMVPMTFRPISALLLFPAMVILFEVGRRFRVRQKIDLTSATVEGAVFALFGLLLAFTFSGAMTRYDVHRQLLVEETNDIGKAYLRLDLLPASAQPALRQLFRDYTTSRLHLFDRKGPAITSQSLDLQQKIWQRAVQGCADPGANPDATKLLLPAINDMIDVTFTRRSAFDMHPPATVYLLLFIFSCGCAFIAGYGMSMDRSWYYAFILAITVTLTIYATLDIEYPQIGLIRLNQSDKGLTELRNSMN